MAGVASAAALVVAAVLLAAAAGKLRHRTRTEAGFARLGLPSPGALAWGVPAVEGVVAVALVVAPGWGGVLAFALLAGFTAYLATLVRSGRQVSCGCFGTSGDHPVSGRDLVRNALLLAACGLAASHTGRLVLEPVPILVAAVAAGAAAVALHRVGVAHVTPGGHNGATTREG